MSFAPSVIAWHDAMVAHGTIEHAVEPRWKIGNVMTQVSDSCSSSGKIEDPDASSRQLKAVHRSVAGRLLSAA